MSTHIWYSHVTLVVAGIRRWALRQEIKEGREDGQAQCEKRVLGVTSMKMILKTDGEASMTRAGRTLPLSMELRPTSGLVRCFETQHATVGLIHRRVF